MVTGRRGTDETDSGGRRPRRQLARLAMAAVWRRYVKTPFWSCWARMQLWWWGARGGRRLLVSGRIRLFVSGELHIGTDVQLNSGPGNYVGGERRMAIWVGRRGRAVIGDGCRISNSTIVATASVEILPQTLIGGGCNIYDTDFHHVDAPARLVNPPPLAPRAAVRIGPRAFVGGHVTVLKGVTIGEGAVIGAGSVVTRDIPERVFAVGNPCRVIRELDD